MSEADLRAEFPSCAASLAVLKQSGTIQVIESEVGDCLQLNPSSISWGLKVTVHHPQQILACDKRSEPVSFHRNKLDVVRVLAKSGLGPSPDPVPAYRPGASKIFPVSSFLKPCTMLVALANASNIFEKGLDEIRMGMRNGYYMCLLRLSNLQGFHHTPGLDRFLEKHFLALSNGKTLPALPDAVAPPAPGDLPALLDGDVGEHGPMHAILDAPPVAMVEHVAVYGIPPVRYEHLGRVIVVYFDNCTSHSGKRRALCVCDLADHGSDVGRCERAVFVEDHGNEPKKAAAFLIAWRMDGDFCSSKAEHLPHDPELAAVEDIVAGI
jgi:hypothetical protein